MNGRSGLAPLAQVVAEICAAGGITDVETRALDGVVEGFVLTGVSSVRAALEPLAAAFGFEVVERGSKLEFRMRGDGHVVALPERAAGDETTRQTRLLMDKAPERVRLTLRMPRTSWTDE